MPVRRFGPFKFKKKAGRMGYEIANSDRSPMEIVSIKLIKDQSSNNKIFADVEYISDDDEEVEKNTE